MYFLCNFFNAFSVFAHLFLFGAYTQQVPLKNRNFLGNLVCFNIVKSVYSPPPYVSHVVGKTPEGSQMPLINTLLQNLSM